VADREELIGQATVITGALEILTSQMTSFGGEDMIVGPGSL